MNNEVEGAREQMLIDGKAKKYDCVLSDLLYIEISSINRTEDGQVDIVFINRDNNQLIRCNFNTYVLAKFYDEMYEYESFIPATGSGTTGGYLQKYGTVLVYENSPYCSQEKLGSLFDAAQGLPTHYHFVTGDDIIEILSFDKPRFEYLD